MRFSIIASLILLLAAPSQDLFLSPAESISQASDGADEIFPISLKYRQKVLDQIELAAPTLASDCWWAIVANIEFLPSSPSPLTAPVSRSARIEEAFGAFSLRC